MPEVCLGTVNRARDPIYLYNVGVGHGKRCPSNFAGTECVPGAKRCDWLARFDFCNFPQSLHVGSSIADLGVILEPSVVKTCALRVGFLNAT